MAADYLRTALTVRLALADDAADIAQIHVRSWQAAYRSILPADYLRALSVPKHRALWNHIIARGMPRVMLAQRDDVTLGWITWGVSRDRDKTRRDAEIEAIYVDPLYWRRGAGRVLIHEAIEAAASESYREITLWALEENHPGVRFYRSIGFTPDGASRTIEVGGKYVTEMRFRQTIA
jgi:GNAT superfamily N-acetyltransferase